MGASESDLPRAASLSRAGERRSGAAGWLEVLLCLATAIGLRAYSLPLSVIDWDETIHVLTAARWLHGGLPYIAVWDHHPIGLPALLMLLAAAIDLSLPLKFWRNYFLALLPPLCLAAAFLGVLAARRAGPRGARWALPATVLLLGSLSARDA